MIAVLNIDGRQLKVEKNQEVYVGRLSGKEGDKITFDEIVMIENGSNISIGQPIIKGAQVKASILQHLKDDKVIVFKKKRRKGYKVKNGHRQMLTKLKIESITEKTATATKKTATATKKTATATKKTATATKKTATATKKTATATKKTNPKS